MTASTNTQGVIWVPYLMVEKVSIISDSRYTQRIRNSKVNDLLDLPDDSEDFGIKSLKSRYSIATASNYLK